MPLVMLFETSDLLAQDSVTYEADIAPVLTKYCVGCHNQQEPEGDLALHNFQAIAEGTPETKVIDKSSPLESILLKRMTGEVAPIMPPDDEPSPTAEEIALVQRWFELGMPRSEADKAAIMLDAPQLKIAPKSQQFIGAACVVRGGLAIGSFGQVELKNRAGKRLWLAEGLAGKVNSIRQSQDRKTVVVSTGVAGLIGQVLLFDSKTGEQLAQFEGHKDSIYCASLSPDGSLLATGSYDRKVILWDVATQKPLRELTGHNGAIYDLDFDKTGRLLATASADQTVKLWNVASGTRIDTLGQPEGEMLCVRFDTKGDFVYAGGADRQIRKWKVTSRDKPSINPMLVARFAHERSVERIAFFDDDHLISTSSDKTVKLWRVGKLEPLGTIAELEDTPVAICVLGKGKVASFVFDLRGNRTRIPREELQQRMHATKTVPNTDEKNTIAAKVESKETLTKIGESEPNGDPQDALQITLPTEISGKIFVPGGDDQAQDVDLYQFAAKAGEAWIIEVNAAKSKSQLDSIIDVLDDTGAPVLQTRLQAVRESYFTFRGKDSDTSDDYRVHKWEDMELDEYIYSGGEVNRLWLYPRGPDSGFKVYPGFGKRYSFFGTTPISHALGDTAYIVRELAPGEEVLPNGLPMFPIFFENDDDGLRRNGKDSRLTFVAPEDGNYFLRLRDARGFAGENFHYKLTIRRPKPDFQITVGGKKLSMPTGCGRQWSITAKRLDGLNAAISVSIEGLPEGFVATNPLIIEAGQERAFGTIFATNNAQLALADPTAKTAGSEENNGAKQEGLEPKSETSQPSKSSLPETVQLSLVARCQVGDQEIVHKLKDKIELSLSHDKEIKLRLFPIGDESGQSQELEELTIHPGQTISAKLVVDRNGEKKRIGFGKDDSGRNLPHGAYVDNIGLNGLLIPEQYSEREFFITAAPKLRPGRRQFHLRADTKGSPTTRPIWLNVVPK